MTTKAKLSLSQLLFRRTNTSNNGYANNGGSGGSNNGGSSHNSNTNGATITEQCGGGGEGFQGFNSYTSRKLSQQQQSTSFGTVSSGRSGFYDFANPPEFLTQKGSDSNQPQLQGILKKPGRGEGDGGGGSTGKIPKSSLHRSRSNPNPSNNPLKEVSWNCPTLEKRREVILNYFERIIMENKQDQNGKARNRPNIPCDERQANGSDRSSGEPIYEEISDYRSANNNSSEKTGSLKPKVMPKKVRMNIPQEQKVYNNGGSPIYDKLLCRSHSMIEPPLYDTASSGSSASSTMSSNQSSYENFRPDFDFGNKSTRRSGRSHSFHENYRSSSSGIGNWNNHSIGSYNIQADPIDTDQLYAKVCKRKKMVKVCDAAGPDHNDSSSSSGDDLRVQVSCANVVTMIPVIMPCSSTFSASCLSLSSSPDNNNFDDPTLLSRGNDFTHHDDNERQYTEKILPDKDIAYVKCDNRGPTRNRNNLSVIHLLATYDPTKEIEEFIPTTTPSFTAIIDSTECAPKSITVPVRAEIRNGNNNASVDRGSSQHYPPDVPPTPLTVANCSFNHHHRHHRIDVLLHEDDDDVDEEEEEDDDDDDDAATKYEVDIVKGFGSVRTGDHITKDLLLLTSDSEDDDDICETKSILTMDTSDLLLPSSNDVNNDKYITLDDDDRGFESFLDESDEKVDGPFKAENFRNQRTFAQQQQSVPQDALKKKAASVLDLINSEISDLHMRELELKKLHPSEKSGKDEVNDGNNTEEFEEGSSEDDFSDSAIEYDGFTTNGSNSSGQVSPSENLNEMNQADEPEPVTPAAVVVTHSTPSDARGGDIKVRPLIEEEDKSIKFSITEETPIEREIRITREREEEFRKLKKQNSAPSPSVPTTPTSQKSESNKVISSVSSRPEIVEKSLSAEPVKDVQYEMATARFRREIEETMQREKELMKEGRLTKKDEEIIAEINSGNDGQQPETKSVEVEPVMSSSLPPAQEMPRKPVLAKLNIATKLPAARFFSPPAYNGYNKQTRIAPVVSPIITKGGGLAFSPSPSANNGPGGSLPIGIGRANFTSMEKYILQSSYNYRNASTSSPKIDEEVGVKSVEPIRPAQIRSIPEDPLRFVQKAKDDEDETEEKEDEDEEKPKRRYVPAQDKIHKEIEELAMREKELNQVRAKWKSTLDLPDEVGDENVVNAAHSTLSLNISSSSASGVTGDDDAEKVNKDNDLGKKASDDDDEMQDVLNVKAPPRRRHSVLINQWEERIRQQQQMNSKK